MVFPQAQHLQAWAIVAFRIVAFCLGRAGLL